MSNSREQRPAIRLQPSPVHEAQQAADNIAANHRIRVDRLNRSLELPMDTVHPTSHVLARFGSAADFNHLDDLYGWRADNTFAHGTTPAHILANRFNSTPELIMAAAQAGVRFSNDPDQFGQTAHAIALTRKEPGVADAIKAEVAATIAREGLALPKPVPPSPPSSPMPPGSNPPSRRRRGKREVAGQHKMAL
jgi:hypothetical protein